MENFSDEILFLIAGHLSVGSVLNLSLACKRFSWLINDNSLFKHLCKREFDIKDKPFINERFEPRSRYEKPLQRYILPEYPIRQKFVYKIIEYLRRELVSTTRTKETRFGVSVQIIDFGEEVPVIRHRNMLENIVTETMVYQPEGTPYSSIYGNYPQELASIRYMNWSHKYSVIDSEYFMDECDGGPFGSHVLLLEEGLAIWDETKFYLVLPMYDVMGLFEKYVPGYDDFDTHVHLEAYEKLYPTVLSEYENAVLFGVRTKLREN